MLKKITWTIAVILTSCGPATDSKPGRHCIEGDCDNGLGRMITRNGQGQIVEDYSGGFMNGQFAGEGVMRTFIDGQLASELSGEFRNGELPVNISEKTFRRGELMAEYRGGYHNGRYSGQGTIELFERNGLRFRRYEGEWRDGVEHGVGKETDAEGNVRAGRWQTGKFVGN